MGELILSEQIIWAKNTCVNPLDMVFPEYQLKLLDPLIKPQAISSFADLAGGIIGLDWIARIAQNCCSVILMVIIKGGGTMPMKVKVFCEKEPSKLEESMNDWLKTKPDIRVAHITQSQVQSGQTISLPVIVCIWYTE
jgi:hypothetical protein